MGNTTAIPNPPLFLLPSPVRAAIVDPGSVPASSPIPFCDKEGTITKVLLANVNVLEVENCVQRTHRIMRVSAKCPKINKYTSYISTPVLKLQLMPFDSHPGVNPNHSKYSCPGS